jgi:hypothetical protein
MVSQAPESGIVALQTTEGREFSLLPLGVRSGSALQPAAALSLPFDATSGVATLATPQGSRVDVMGAPPDLPALLALLAPFGVRELTIERGHFRLRTGDPALTGIIRFDGEITRGGPAGLQMGSDGGVRLTYADGRRQLAFPIFADLPGLLQFLSTVPGVSGIQPEPAGTVLALVSGQAFRLLPAFTLLSGGPGGPPQLVPEGPDAFTFVSADGRRQRFTVGR